MKCRLFISAILALSMTGCSEQAEMQEPISSALEHTHSMTDSEPASNNDELLEVQVISYENDTLSFVRDGETLSLKMSPELFANDSYTRGKKTMSEKIISNHFGLGTKGFIRLDSEGNIKYCDVYKANGDEFDSSMTAPAGTPYEDTFMNMKRIRGSQYEFSNSYAAFIADLNELDNDIKGDYGEEQQGVEVSGYRFKTGEIILECINIFDHKETVGGETQYYFNMMDNYDKYSFFGTVKSLSDDRAEVLLTDGKTLCDVPTYYNDGKLKEGMQVMVTLNAEPDLFGSGKEYKDSFAVFHTDPEEYNTSGSKFSELAFARYDQANSFKYIYSKADEIR